MSRIGLKNDHMFEYRGVDFTVTVELKVAMPEEFWVDVGEEPSRATCTRSLERQHRSSCPTLDAHIDFA